MAAAVNRRVIGFSHEAHFRHRGAPVSGSLRPSATVAAWQPGPAAPFRGRRRFALSAALLAAVRHARNSLTRNLPRSACARLHPRPGRRRRVPAASPAASRCSRCSRLSLSASDNASPTEAGLVQTNIASMSIGVARPGCVPCRTGSRLGFFRHFLLPGEQPPPPSVGTGRCRGAPRLNTFLPIPPPIRQ